ncbi:MAG: alpha/beta fold hydrolase [Pseudomonadota bacterium]
MTLHHVVDGDGPPLLLSGSLGTTHAMWDANTARLTGRHTVIRYDHPGHGASDAGPRTLEGFAEAALAVADEVGVDRFAFCGLSLGGMVGMWLGANAPERLERLVLCCTAPHLPPPQGWLDRAATVRREGVGAVADAVVGRWFTDRFPDRDRWRDVLASTPREGYARACEAIAAMDLRPDLARIHVPTTVILGRHDPVVDEAAAALLARLGPVTWLDAAHLANVERPDEFTDSVLVA